MRAGAGLSMLPDGPAAAAEAAGAAVAELGSTGVDLALVFATPHHARSADAMLAEVHDVADPGGLIGCVAEAVLGGDREVEEGPAVSVWVGTFPGPVETFHMEFVRTASGGAFAGWRFNAGGGADGADALHLMMCDPYSFPVDHLLEHLNRSLPGTLVVGGIAGGAPGPGETILFQDRKVHRGGAVGARIGGRVAVRTLVSQGCRPVGDAFVITRANGNVIQELGGRPPLERLQELVSALSPDDRELLSRGAHVGRAIDEYKTELGVGDFLIRGVVGADPRTGAVAVGDQIEVGQTVRFHVRDATTADEELRAMLERESATLPGRAAGALLFTCNGRGSRLFAQPDHDASVVSSYLGRAPLAGFFCAGELGPVGGKNFLHGFTASLALFLDDDPGTGRAD